VPPPDAEWIAALPKAEIHLHLEGCVPHDLVATAAARQGVRGVDPDRPPKVTSLAQLLAYLDLSCGVIDRADDLSAIAYATAKRAVGSGTRHVDVIVNPTHWPWWSGRLEAMLDALDAGFDAAEQDGLATATLCVSLKRTQTATEAHELVDRLIARRHPRVSGLSIDGDESAGSHTDRFVEAFARAKAAGLRRCAHAGESSGAEGVREAVVALGAERIDHGIRCIEDPALVAELSDRRIPLDICPSSNVILGVAPSLAEHPVEALRGAGIRFSLNTDDPLLYGIDLAGEYRRCAETFGWDGAVLGEVAAVSIDSCFADEGRRRDLAGELAAYLNGDGTPNSPSSSISP
jgi:adenosine deaminase